MIKVQVARDRMGGLTLTPSKKIQRQAIKHLRELGHEHADGTALIQSEEDAQLFVETHLSEGQQRDLRDGWDVTIDMDPWDYGHLVGYDFHEAIKA